MAQGITAVKLGPDGIVLFDAHGRIATLKWTAIDRLRAYQHNVFMYALTCIDIHVAESNYLWTLTEETQDFWDFSDYCKQLLPSFDSNWEAVVRATPNAENSLIIYSKSPLTGRP